MLLHGLRHQEIIAFPWTVNSRRTENHIREIGEGFQIFLGMQFTQSVRRIWPGSVRFTNG